MQSTFIIMVVCTVRKIKKSFALLGSLRLHAGDGFPADSGTTATPETNSTLWTSTFLFNDF